MGILQILRSSERWENALITHLQEFLLEMGKGFCFEARQKRMIIDDAQSFNNDFLVIY